MAQSKWEDKRTVLKFCLIGLILVSVLFTTGSLYFPATGPKLTSVSAKLAFTLRWQVLSVFVLAVAIQRIGSIRFETPAIDPIHGRGEQFLGIDSRFLQNTLEQVVVNNVGQLILATYLDDSIQRVIPTLVVIFVVGRILFYIGYRIQPLYRSTGFFMSAFPCYLTYFYCIYCMFVYGPTYALG